MANKRLVQLNKRGFTLIEVLFSLSICLLIVLNTVPIVKTITYTDKIATNNTIYAIGVKQIATILYTAKEINVGNELTFLDSSDKLHTFLLHDHRIVKEPGFDIIIRDVESLDFYVNNEKVYMHLNNGHTDFDYLIATDYTSKLNDEKDDEIQ